VIVIDSSAVIAMLFREPTASRIAKRLAADPQRTMSAASYVEVGTVLAGRRKTRPEKATDDLNAFLEEARIDLAPVDAAQARLALDARIRYGRGFGKRGGLNFGDCFAYALAKTLKAPLLFVGSDFAHTDVESALGG
jgi:ribonuclease VapC